jgi:hypothetical protein
VLLVFAAVFRAEAQEGDIFRHPLGPHNLGAFSKTCAALAKHPFIKGEFEQEKVLGRLGRSLKSGGNFIIAADMGMVWETTRPFPSTLALGKDYLVQSRPGGQKTTLSAQGNETFLRFAEVISAVFSGNAQGLLDNFEVYYAGGETAWELGLSPLDRAIGSFAARITMSGDSAIRLITISEQNGDVIRYTLSRHVYPPELAAHEKALFAVP